MRPVARLRIERAAFGLLDASTLCAIVTAAPRTRAHLHTAYFVWTRDFEVFWLSDPAATHSRNIRALRARRSPSSTPIRSGENLTAAFSCLDRRIHSQQPRSRTQSPCTLRAFRGTRRLTSPPTGSTAFAPN